MSIDFWVRCSEAPSCQAKRLASTLSGGRWTCGPCKRHEPFRPRTKERKPRDPRI